VQGNTRSTKEETQKAQTNQGSVFVLFALNLGFLCSKSLNLIPLKKGSLASATSNDMESVWHGAVDAARLHGRLAIGPAGANW
jgi:hypothetical protein